MFIARSCGIIRKQLLRTPAATPASVHLAERAWPLGDTRRSACVVSPDLVIAVAVFSSAPLRARRGGGHQNICSRARFLIPRTANWSQRSSRVPTLLLMLWEGGWEWAGPSDSFELANLTPPHPRLRHPDGSLRHEAPA